MSGMMKHSQVIEGGPSYSRDMWDNHGIEMIKERIDKSRKSMKQLRDFFQDAANMSFRNAQTTHKLQSMNTDSVEFGTLKFVEDRYCELIETMSKNEEILGSKIRTQCYQKLHDQIHRIQRVNTKLLSDLGHWQKSLEREQKKLRRAKQSYDDKKRQCLAVEKALNLEKDHLNAVKGNPSQMNKAPQIESNIMSMQQKVKGMQAQHREQLDHYIKAVSVYRGFRLKYDSATSTVLDQLEQTEVDRSQMLHRVLKLYLEIQQVMVQQSLRNIDTISKHIANIDAHSDNMVFVEKYRSNQKRPPLPDPKFHPDDEDDGTKSFSADDENLGIEQSAEVLYWCEKWRLVVGKILQRDIELISPKLSAAADLKGLKGLKDKDVLPLHSSLDTDSKDSKDKLPPTSSSEIASDQSKEDAFAFIQLTDDEYTTLRAKCIESLARSEGRVAFSLIINRQRNTEYGLELQMAQFTGLVELIHLFLDSVQKSHPLDIKPAKLVMIMSQSLYVKKANIDDDGGGGDAADEESKTDPVNEADGGSGGNVEEEELDGQDVQQMLRRKSTMNAFNKNDKLFVVDRVKNHAVWKNDKFWKEAYCDSVQQEILKYPPVKKWHSEHERQEAERREEQIIFSQLAAWTHNMKEFGTEEAKICRFLETRGLAADKVNMLKMTLNLQSPELSSLNGSPMSQKLHSSFQTEDSLISQEINGLP